MTDEEMAFLQIERQGYVIRPWTFNQLVQLSTTLDSIAKRAEDMGIDFGNVFGGKLPGTMIARLVFQSMADTEKLLTTSLDIKKNEVGQLRSRAVLDLLMGIWEVNKEEIGGFFTDLAEKAEAMEDAATPPAGSPINTAKKKAGGKKAV